ncbi:hypothetical protein GALL_531890 [mine drainage metagenome]|uniref:Uncharacterized protein n=1 Tax=mine drainage metagenome TaxID=410659 RepID=A0A1J5P3K6_9ZZZZ
MLAQAPAGAGGEVQVAGAQHGARLRRPPEDGILRPVPGEDAAAVGQQEARQAEVAADGEETLLGLFGIGENEFPPQANDRHRAPSLTSTVAEPPCARGPKRMASARGRRSSRSMSRAMGRAPKAGS